MEECFWSALEVTRRTLESERELVAMFADRLQEARRRLDSHGRTPRDNAAKIEKIYEIKLADDEKALLANTIEAVKKTSLVSPEGRPIRTSTSLPSSRATAVPVLCSESWSSSADRRSDPVR